MALVALATLTEAALAMLAAAPTWLPVIVRWAALIMFVGVAVFVWLGGDPAGRDVGKCEYSSAGPANC